MRDGDAGALAVQVIAGGGGGEYGQLVAGDHALYLHGAEELLQHSALVGVVDLEIGRAHV